MEGLARCQVEHDQRRRFEFGRCLSQRAFGSGDDLGAGSTILQALQRLAHQVLEVDQQPRNDGCKGKRLVASEILRALAMSTDKGGINQSLAQHLRDAGIELVILFSLFLVLETIHFESHSSVA